MPMENQWTRRDMMKGAGFAALALGVDGLFRSASASETRGTPSGTPGKCMLPPLPYPYDALEPHIDKETLTIHHDRHHAGYVNNFNKALDRLAVARKENDYAMIKHWSRELAFHGSGHVLHALYWGNMSSKGGEPKGEFLAAMKKSFGGYKQFKEQFFAATKAVEGSGWGILGHEPYQGYLVILQAEKHQDQSIWGIHPLLVCDVWEHAYYLKYRNKRGDYINNFLKIIDWQEVERRYDMVKGVKGYR
jgi:Fe-Mn family superoxide dismutase